MIIKLPHIDPVDTLKPPCDLSDRVSYSFTKFTELTHPDYTYEDKLLYLDNLRGFLHPVNAEDSVKNLILDVAEFELDEYGELPDKDDFWDLGFMAECYRKGDKTFRAVYERTSHRDNEKTLKVIFEIIKVVTNWEAEDGKI